MNYLGTKRVFDTLRFNEAKFDTPQISEGAGLAKQTISENNAMKYQHQ